MEMLYKIKKTLKKKNESIILDLYLKNYDKSNFYFALVFNKRIEKFKVLYVPLDAIGKGDDVEEYFCYQFIFLHTVNYILESINSNQEKFRDEDFRLKANMSMDAYYVELNLYDIPEDYKFTFSQYIDKDFAVLFEIIVVLFEHLPNIVSELCNKLLIDFNEDSEAVKYTNSYDFNLKNGKLEDLFSKAVIKKNKYTLEDIEFLENTGNRYYAVINDNLIIIDYISGKEIFNVSCGDLDPLGYEVCTVVDAIQKNVEKKFYRLKVTTEGEEIDGDSATYYYLCYGIAEEEFKVFNKKDDRDISLDLISRGKVKILNSSKSFENEIKEYLSIKYEKSRVNEIINSVFVR